MQVRLCMPVGCGWEGATHTRNCEPASGKVQSCWWNTVRRPTGVSLMSCSAHE